MSYFFFMGTMQLPVPPSKMTLKINGRNKTMNLINDGEINILKTPGLSEISFEALLPNQQYPFSSYILGFKKSTYFVETFETLKTSFQPFQFIVCRMGTGFEFLSETNLTAVLEDYDIVEDAGNGFDAMASIRLKQYKPYATKTATITKNEDGSTTVKVNEPRATTKSPDLVHKIVAGETLWEVCKKGLGSGQGWQAIASINNIVNPNSLDSKIGQVIKYAK